ncbi:MAG: LTA synthase family protein, partial [Bacteroidales bacterium]|nr:LTA synthase family protein [Bacteroidales bacterium]
MKQYLLTLGKLFLFWLCFFFVGRLLFLLAYHHMAAGVPLPEVAACFPHALRLDASAVCYLMAPSILLLSLSLCFRKRLLVWLADGVVLLELLVCSLVQMGEIAVYGEWLSKLNYKILLYLRRPMEIIRTATGGQLFFSLLAIVVLVGGFFLLYRKLVVRPAVVPLRRRWLWAPPALLIPGALCFVGMRGGFNAIPITQSAAYYSTCTLLNDAAVNPAWNLACSFYDFGDVDPDRYRFMEDAEAEALLSQVRRAEKEEEVSLWGGKKVNIVFILLESWSADLIESLSGTQGVADCFHALEAEGLLFTRFYANGHRSQQAMASIFSGFPPLPMYDITDDFSKYSRLPSLAADLKKAGYHTSFYFGGNLDYGNIRSYLLHCGFERMVEEKDLDRKLPRGKLGIHDQYLFDIHHQALNREREPFLSVLFTLSSHSPYDQPLLREVGEVSIRHEETPFLNAVRYCDHFLGRYFEAVRKEPWYRNTLFVVMGDHSHPTHLGTQNLTPEYQHVPCL